MRLHSSMSVEDCAVRLCKLGEVPVGPGCPAIGKVPEAGVGEGNVVE